MLNSKVEQFIQGNQNGKTATLAKALANEKKLLDENFQGLSGSFISIIELQILNIELQLMKESVMAYTDMNKDGWKTNYLSDFNCHHEMSDWDFVGDYYPGYHQCDLIAYSNDLSVLRDGSNGTPCLLDEDSCAEDILNADFGGDINSILIDSELIKTDHEVYIIAIEACIENKLQAIPVTL